MLVHLLALPLALIGARTDAQVSPLWDYHKVFQVLPSPPAVNIPVVLTDEFGVSNHVVQALTWFTAPVQTEIVGGQTYPLNDPITHYAWWKITDQPFAVTVLAANQFGTQTLHIHDAMYLLNPALANQSGAPPFKNHYKCYSCDGQHLAVQVLLTEQGGSNPNCCPVGLAFPWFFCNPVETFISAAQVYPMVDPKQHYVCYQIRPYDDAVLSERFTDEFLQNFLITLRSGVYLCVPTEVVGVTPTHRDSWGMLKILYR